MPLAITDLKILEGEGARAPSGWEKLSLDMNQGAGGAYLYLAYRRDPAKQAQAITGLQIVSAGAPSGWEKLETDLNKQAGGSDLFLAFKRGGGTPIIALQLMTGKSEAIHGYKVVNRDLNESAGGEDIFLAYLPKTRTLTIKNIKCNSPSTGVGGLARTAITASTTALFAAGAAGVAASIGAATGPGAVALGVGAAAVGAGAGVVVGDALNSAVSDFGKDTSDDVYIKVNGKKVWPVGSKYEGMRKNDKRSVNVTVPLDRDIQVTIMEWDLIEDDNLGENSYSKNESDGYRTELYFNKDEDDIYTVELEIAA